MDNFKNKNLKLILIIALLFLIRFLPFLLGKTLVFGDNYSLMVPGKIFTANWLRQGILPLWNNLIFSGINLVGDVNQSILYPSTLIFLIFPTNLALNITIVLHNLLTFGAMYFLTKVLIKRKYFALITAFLWTFSTHTTGSINNLSTIQSLSYLPWVLYFGLNILKGFKYQFLYSLIILLQFAGGYPQHVIYSILASVLLSNVLNLEKEKWKNWLINWIKTGILTILISSVIWMPFIESFLESTRMEQTTTQAQVGSLNPLMMTKIFLSYFWDKPSAGMKWGPAWSGQPNAVFYVTLFGLLIIGQSLWRKRKSKLEKFFIYFTAGSLILSLGSYLPGYELVQKLIPFFRVGRYPSMILMITNIFICLWVGIALEKIKKPINNKWLKILGLVLFLSLIIFILINTNFEMIWNSVDQLIQGKLTNSIFHTLERDRIITQVISQNLVINLLGLILAIWFFNKKKYFFLTLVIALDMLYATQALFFWAPNSIYPTQNKIKKTSGKILDKQIENNYRIITRNENEPYTYYGAYWEAMVVRSPFSDSFVDSQELSEFNHVKRLGNGLTPNANMIYDVPIINGYTALLPSDYAKIWENKPDPGINFVDKIDINNSKLQDWSVKYYLVDNWFPIKEDLSNLKVIAEKDNWTLYELPDTKARFRYENGTGIEMINFSENPNRISFSFSNLENQNIIIADRYDQNWQAKINGEKVIIKNYNGMREIPIQMGENNLIMQYVPREFYLGLIISFLSFSISMIYYKKFSHPDSSKEGAQTFARLPTPKGGKNEHN